MYLGRTLSPLVQGLTFGWISACRRLLHDDGRGVMEVLNETVCNNGGQCEGLTVSSKGQFS